MMNNNFLERYLPLPIGAIGTDLNTAALVGDRVPMKNFDRLCVLIQLGASTGSTVEVTLRQHTAGSGGTSKDLLTKNPYYKKVGLATTWTRVESNEVEYAKVTETTDLGGAAGWLCLEILGEDLDQNNAFNHVSVDFADSATAKLVQGFYILGNPRFAPAYATAP